MEIGANTPAVVTGGASGLGRCQRRGFAEGARVSAGGCVSVLLAEGDAQEWPGPIEGRRA